MLAICDKKGTISMILDGVVTLYNPDVTVLANIESYRSYLRTLYVVDNSINENIRKCLENKPNVIYISFNENKGIANAFNYVLGEDKDASFLLTMDQDTVFPINMMRNYIRQVELWEKEKKEDVAIYTVRIEHKNGLREKWNSRNAEYIDCTITSGSIVNVSAARTIGGYNNELFLDEVDSDFSLAARHHGYRIVRFNEIYINHAIGDISVEKFLWLTYNTSNHSAIRRYYMVRNRLYMMRKYPEIRKIYGISLLKIFIKVLLAEKNKRRKLKYMFWGINDFFQGHMGVLKR